jgi:hypothetical protein
MDWYGLVLGTGGTDVIVAFLFGSLVAGLIAGGLGAVLASVIG